MRSPILSYQAYFVLGLIHEAQHEQRSSYEAFEKARAGLEHLRSHLQAEDLKIAFLKDKLAIYEGLVSTCLALGSTAEHQEAAFGYIEQAKSRSLADLIAFRASALVPQIESDLGRGRQPARTGTTARSRSVRPEKRSARPIALQTSRSGSNQLVSR